MTGLRERKRVERRRQILTAAARRFRQKGFHATRMEDVARIADVSPGTVYNHFPTKEDLVLGLVDMYHEDSRPTRAQIVCDPPGDPTTALLAYYSALLDWSLTYFTKPLWRHVRAVLAVNSDREDRAFLRTEQGMIEEQVAIIRRLQSSGTVPKHLDARLLATTVHSIGFYWWRHFLSAEKMTVAQARSVVKRHLKFLFVNLD